MKYELIFGCRSINYQKQSTFVKYEQVKYQALKDAAFSTNAILRETRKSCQIILSKLFRKGFISSVFDIGE